MKPRNLMLQISVCLAIGGLVTVVIICFLIGFGLHSLVGKYALYNALFLQLISLAVNFFTDRRSTKGTNAYSPSKRILRFRLGAEILWALGFAFQAGALVLMLLGMKPTEPWIVRLCLAGIILSPIGWMGILMSSYRKRSAIGVLLSRKNPDPVEVR